MRIPFFSSLESGQRFLLAGCGGGYDIASAIPLYIYLRTLGKEVILGNFSFTELEFTDCAEIFPGCFQMDERPARVPYFPEKFVYDWLCLQGENNPLVYAFSKKLGVQSLRHIYKSLRERHLLDTLILCDGGTDSLMFGDEHGVGTLVEDSLSILASNGAGFTHSYLAAIGFGVEWHHQLDHYPCLGNIATLTREGGYLGALSLTREMPEGSAFLNLVEYLNERLPSHRSIVANTIASAMQGNFGDYHVMARTKGSEQFINPLMPLYWFFALPALAKHITYAEAVEHTQSMEEFLQIYSAQRAIQPRRSGRRELPF